MSLFYSGIGMKQWILAVINLELELIHLSTNDKVNKTTWITSIQFDVSFLDLDEIHSTWSAFIVTANAVKNSYAGFMMNRKIIRNV